MVLEKIFDMLTVSVGVLLVRAISVCSLTVWVAVCSSVGVIAKLKPLIVCEVDWVVSLSTLVGAFMV